MRIDTFLAQNPWSETFDLLCREPPPPTELPLAVAAHLIEQQRESQLASLIPLMLSPVVTDSADGPVARIESDRERLGTRRLREPRRTARLFIDQAVRAGKDLRHFDPVDLEKLGDNDAALGRLLRLLSIAESSPLKARSGLAGEWRAVTRKRADFGPVLSPMVIESKGELDGQAIGRLVSGLALRLDNGSGAPSGRGKEAAELEHWTITLAREGHQRVLELRAAKS